MTRRRKKLVYYVLIPLLLLYCLFAAWQWYSSQLGLLSNAVYMGNLPDVRKYVGRFPWAVDYQRYDLSLLQDAVEKGHREVAEILVAKGATVDIHSAAGLGMVDEVERLLKSAPELVEKRIGVKDRTPLHFAAIMGEEATIRLLVDKGASIDASGGWGSPLYDAVDRGRLGAVKLLIDLGAAINGPEAIQSSPLIAAISRRYTDVAAFLIQSGANVDRRTKEGSHPLGYAACSKNLELLKTVVAGCPNVNVRSSLGRTPLLLAIEGGWLEGVKLLLDHGADPLLADDAGTTPLAAARKSRNQELIRLIESRLEE